MKMARTLVAASVLSFMCGGCMGRIFAEWMGAAKGASGKVVESGSTPDLTKYKSLHIEPITVAGGSKVPGDMPNMVQMDFETVARSGADGREFESDGDCGVGSRMSAPFNPI